MAPIIYEYLATAFHDSIVQFVSKNEFCQKTGKPWKCIRAFHEVRTLITLTFIGEAVVSTMFKLDVRHTDNT